MDQQEAIVTILEDDIDDLKAYFSKLSPEKRIRIQNSLKHVKTGLYAVAPITCGGPNKCPFFSHCPIPDRSGLEVIIGPLEDYPIGRSCVLESMYIKQKTIDYIQHLKVDSENPIEMGLVNELSLIDLYKNRAAMILSSGDRDGQGADFLRVDISEIADNGNGKDKMIMSQSTQIHPALIVIEQLEKRREKLIDKLLESRKAKAEIAIKMGRGRRDDSLMLEELRKVREMLTSQSTQVQQLTKDEEIPLKD